MDDNDSDISEPECYLYVQIVGTQTGKSPLRQIVPSTCVKRFNYNDYKENNQIYKNKLLKIRLHPDKEKEKCYVLYAATHQHEVQKKSAEKRFAPPPGAFSETLTDESTSVNSSQKEGRTGYSQTENNSSQEYTEEDEMEEAKKNKKEMLQTAKKSRKRTAEIIINNKESDQNRILQTYLHDLDNTENDLDDTEDEFDVPPKTSTPTHDKVSKKNQSDKTTIRQQEIRIKHLEYQLKNCRKEIATVINYGKENELNSNENINDNEHRKTVNISNKVCCSGIDPFKIHDKMFEFSKEHAEQALEYNEEGNVHLGLQVYCNPIAFNDAYKSKKPWNCLSLLSEGVYGLEELSQRCVRKQKNTKNCKVLSPTKRLAIERKVYAFMRMKDLTINQIDDFLDNLNNYHRKVINGAKSRIEYLQKEKEKEKQVDQQVEEIAQDPAGT